jgi:hypothetical protein
VPQHLGSLIVAGRLGLELTTPLRSGRRGPQLSGGGYAWYMSVRLPAVRPPAQRAIADLVRIAASVSAAAALFALPSASAGARFIIVLLVLMLPRMLGVSAPQAEIVCGTVLIAGTWLAVMHDLAPWLGWLDRAATTGAAAVLLHVALTRTGLVRPVGVATVVRTVTSIVLLGFLIGLTRMGFEWFAPLAMGAPSAGGEQPAPPTLLAAHALGALAAGGCLIWWADRSRRVTTPVILERGCEPRPVVTRSGWARAASRVTAPHH